MRSILGQTTKGEEQRQRIISAALHLFAERGYAGTSVQRIAGEVGISKQLVLYHFQTKDGLKDGVLTSLMARWMPIFEGFVRLARGEDADIDQVLEHLIAMYEEHPASARFWLRELLDNSSQIRASLEEITYPRMKSLVDEAQVDDADQVLAALELVALSMLTVFAIYGETDLYESRVVLLKKALIALF